MTLQEALDASMPDQYIARQKWRKAGILMRILTTRNVIEELNLDLTDESLQANDWGVYDIEHHLEIDKKHPKAILCNDKEFFTAIFPLYQLKDNDEEEEVSE